MKRIIPVLDIAKANPRIPLPIMALLRLKTDMPNDVFPSNCNKNTTELSNYALKVIVFILSLHIHRESIRLIHVWHASREYSHLWSGCLSWLRFYVGETPLVHPGLRPHRSYTRQWKQTHRTVIYHGTRGAKWCTLSSTFYGCESLPIILGMSIHLLKLHADLWCCNFWRTWRCTFAGPSSNL